MPGMGPPPKQPGTRQRRNAQVAAVVALPSAGRQGKTPPWPLIEDIALKVKRAAMVAKEDEFQTVIEETDSIKTQRKLERQQEALREQIEIVDRQIEAQNTLEVEMWAELWRTPQAQMWEQLAWQRDVAQYVRWKVRAELGDLEAAKEARMWSDRLGLNPLALLRLRWQIEQTDAVETKGAQRRTAAERAAQQRTAKDDPRKGLHAV